MKPTPRILSTLAYWLILLVFMTIATVVLSPVHELAHYVPCKLANLSPVMSYYQVNCDGIGNTSDTVQFAYFMSPYILSLIVLIIGYQYIKHHKAVKYLLLIPVMDIIFNYAVSPTTRSDFFFLASNTGPIPFILAMCIPLSTVLLTIRIITKTNILSVKTFEKDYATILDPASDWIRSKIHPAKK